MLRDLLEINLKNKGVKIMVDTKQESMEFLILSDLKDDNLLVNSSPHIKDKSSTQSIMRDVLIALIPTSLVGVLVFGLRAIFIIATCAISAVISEYAFQKITKRNHHKGFKFYCYRSFTCFKSTY